MNSENNNNEVVTNPISSGDNPSLEPVNNNEMVIDESNVQTLDFGDSTDNPDATLEKTMSINPSMQSMGDLPQEGDNTSNISYDTKDAYNEFADQPPKKKKFPMVFVLMAVLIIGAACGGYYYFFVYKNATAPAGGASTIELKDVTIELGEEIPTTITTYVNKDLKQTEYKLVTSKINNNKVGDYTYTVTYNNKKYDGKVKVVDSVAPVLTTKDVTTNDISTLNITGFIDSCIDASSCECAYVDASVISNITSDGTYTIDIKAFDEYGNVSTKTAKLVVNKGLVINNVTCSKTSSTSTEYKSLVYDTVISFDDKNVITNLVENKLYTFNTLDELTLHQKSNTEGTYDKTNLTLKKVQTFTSSQLASDNTRKSIPTSKTDTIKFFNNIGYTCK